MYGTGSIPLQAGQVPVANITASTATSPDSRHPHRKLIRTHSGSKLRHGGQNRLRSPQQKSPSKAPTTWFQPSNEAPPLTYKTEVNVLLWLLVSVGFMLRFWKLDLPRHIM